jgi:hypothetical protein
MMRNRGNNPDLEQLIKDAKMRSNGIRTQKL